jgi:non-specific serine/threonine protein kinase
MSHPFGDLLNQYRARKHGLTQARLAALAGYDASLITKLCQGRKELTGPSGRERVVRLMSVLRDEGVLTRLDEANALLKAAGMPPLFEGNPDEAGLMRRLKAPVDVDAGSTPLLTRHTNLPHPLTRFIGRERLIADLVERVQTTRLLTLTGAGGVGKTRLAIEVGAGLFDNDAFPDGVWWVELAPLADPALVPQAVVSALGLPEQPDQTSLEVLQSFLTRRQALLMLDNCEHLIEACAGLSVQLLSSCPRLHILVTSRETLRIPGEVTWRVPSLTTPDPSNLPPLGELLNIEAVHLFIDRAAAAQPAFTLEPDHVTAIAQVCHRLDGIPLAIELAASRLNGLSVTEIASRLDDRFHLLTGGSRTALPRHQTLHTLIDWSYDLLPEPERVLLERLSVFAGGWTLEMAEAVCADSSEGSITLRVADILPLLMNLINKSLVVVGETGAGATGETRYRLLETIRVFASEKLAQRGEAVALHHRYAQAYLGLAEQAAPHFDTPDRKVWLERIARERDNIRAVLTWSLSADGDPLPGMRLAAALWLYWRWHGATSEGHKWFQALLPVMPANAPHDMRARALLGAAAFTIEGIGFSKPESLQHLATWLDEAFNLFQAVGDMAGVVYSMYYQSWLAELQHDLIRARSILEQSLIIARQVAYPSATLRPLHSLAVIAIGQGKFERATALLEECLVLARQVGEGGDGYELAPVLCALGTVAFQQCNFVAARDYARQGLTEARRGGNKHYERIAVTQIGEASRFLGDFQQARASFAETYQLSLSAEDDAGVETALHLLGKVACDEGDYTQAFNLLAESLRVGRTKGDWLTPFTLDWLATVASGSGQARRAARLFGAAEALRAAQGRPVPRDSIAEYKRHVAATLSQLDEATFASAWVEGQQMTLEQAVEYALRGSDEDETQQEDVRSQ